MRTALVTGGSTGLGLALVGALADDGWHVITDARDPARLGDAVRRLGAEVEPIAGDVTDPDHRQDLDSAVEAAGGLDLLVHNASTLGRSPQPTLADLDDATFDDIWLTNVAAPLALTRLLLPRLLEGNGVLLSLSSDAAVEHYEGWGGYAASKAALDHLTLTLAAEHPALRAYAVDPGDMRTAMHQSAFPDEDISDRPLPTQVLPGFLGLLDRRPPSGRYRAADFAPADQEVAS